VPTQLALLLRRFPGLLPVLLVVLSLFAAKFGNPGGGYSMWDGPI
jgi:hypothetical protein